MNGQYTTMAVIAMLLVIIAIWMDPTGNEPEVIMTPTTHVEGCFEANAFPPSGEVWIEEVGTQLVKCHKFTANSIEEIEGEINSYAGYYEIVSTIVIQDGKTTLYVELTHGETVYVETLSHLVNTAISEFAGMSINVSISIMRENSSLLILWNSQ